MELRHGSTTVVDDPHTSYGGPRSHSSSATRTLLLLLLLLVHSVKKGLVGYKGATPREAITTYERAYLPTELGNYRV